MLASIAALSLASSASALASSSASAPVSSSASAPASSTAPNIKATYTTTVDMHISDVMTVFMDDKLNSEWSPTLEADRIIYSKEHGPLAHQQYKLPWPMAPREALLSCERKFNHRDGVVTSECHSVNAAEMPVRDGVVRLILENTAWKVEALSDERTRLTLSLEMPASNIIGVPKYVVKYCQTKSLKDSVNALIAAVERLQLPPHENFVRWKRSRAAAAAVMRRMSQSSAPTSLLATLAEHATASSIAVALAAVIGAIVLHALAFASLAYFSSRPSRRSPSSSPLRYSSRSKKLGDTLAGRASPTTVMQR